MATYLIYVLTLDPATHKIARSEEPVGWIARSRIREARIDARRLYKLRGNQAPHLERNLIRLIRKIRRRQETAVKHGRDAAFITHYRAALAARRTKRL